MVDIPSSEKAINEPACRFTLPRFGPIVVVFVLAMLLWLIGGHVSLQMALVDGLILACPIMYLAKHKAMILCVSVDGACTAMILGFCFVPINVHALNTVNDLGKAPYAIKLIWWWPIVGALLGPVLYGTGTWMRRFFEFQQNGQPTMKES